MVSSGASLEDQSHVVFDASQLHFNFNMAGDKSIAPMRVYTDGIRTWFDYENKIKRRYLPSIYLVQDGVDTPINVTRIGNRLVAQAAGDFTLRHGKKITCVMQTKEELS